MLSEHTPNRPAKAAKLTTGRTTLGRVNSYTLGSLKEYWQGRSRVSSPDGPTASAHPRPLALDRSAAVLPVSSPQYPAGATCPRVPCWYPTARTVGRRSQRTVTTHRCSLLFTPVAARTMRPSGPTRAQPCSLPRPSAPPPHTPANAMRCDAMRCTRDLRPGRSADAVHSL
jgi:hypothetical protein